MWPAWAPERVQQRHLRYAQSLVSRNVSIRQLEYTDQTSVEQLVRTHIAGSDDFAFSADEGGLVAEDESGEILGAVVAAGAQFGSAAAVFVRHLVVSPSWRGQGVGVVTLGVLPQILPAAWLYLGNCAVKDARFYQRAGYTVLDPNQPFLIPFGTRQQLVIGNRHYPCWFHKP